MRDTSSTRADAPAAETAGPPACRDLAAPLTGLLLGVQRSAGNRAVVHLAGRLARAAADDTGQMHEEVYGDSSFAHGPAYDPRKDPAARRQALAGTHFLQRNRDGAQFDWAAYPPGSSPLLDWLHFYEFRPRRPPDPAAEGCEFNLWKYSTVAYVADTFVDDARLSGLHFAADAVRTEVTKHLRWRQGFPVTDEYQQARQGAAGPAKLGPVRAPALTPLGDGGGPQLTIGLQFNLTKHVDAKTGEGSTDPPAVQLTGQVAIPFHKPEQAGWELSAQANVSFALQVQPGRAGVLGLPRVDETSVRVTGVSSAQGAAQAAWVVPLIQKTLQLQAFAQVVAAVNWNAVPAGEARTGGSDSVLKLRRDPTAQLAAGVQAVYTVPGTGQHLQLFAGIQGSGTTSRQGQTADAQLTLGAQWAFDL